MYSEKSHRTLCDQTGCDLFTSSSAFLQFFYSVSSSEVALFLSLEYNFLNLICSSLRQSCHLVFLTAVNSLLKCHPSLWPKYISLLIALSSSAALLYCAYHYIYLFFVYSWLDRGHVCVTFETPVMCLPHSQLQQMYMEFESE